MDWVDIMPSLAELNVIVGTPVRMRPGHAPAGWVEKNNQTLTVRPWGDDHPTHCLVIDNTGTSMPVPWDCLTIDLEHPLGLAAGMMVMGHHYMRVKSYAICSPEYEMLKEIRIILAGDIEKKVQDQNTQTHREV
tara:strand:- start:311 stop:712 length:402 start_codon:yes stop_codon:yes gene_type:complete